MKRDVIRRAVRKPSSRDSDHVLRDSGVQSVDRALQIIETLAEDEGGYRLTDLAIRTGLSPSTVHRLLTTLETRRFVWFDRGVSKWHVGSKAFIVGSVFAQRSSVTAQALPVLRKLRDQSHETANLAVVDDGAIVVVSRAESREIMRSLARVGGHVATFASGVGKAVLATYPYEAVSELIRVQGMPRLTERSIVRASELFRELESVRKLGYAVDDEEARLGVRCVAAAVLRDSGEPIAAISVSGASDRITDKRVAQIGLIVREAATELTAAMCSAKPAPHPEALGDFR